MACCNIEHLNITRVLILWGVNFVDFVGSFCPQKLLNFISHQIFWPYGSLRLLQYSEQHNIHDCFSHTVSLLQQTGQTLLLLGS